MRLRSPPPWSEFLLGPPGTTPSPIGWFDNRARARERERERARAASSVSGRRTIYSAIYIGPRAQRAQERHVPTRAQVVSFLAPAAPCHYQLQLPAPAFVTALTRDSRVCTARVRQISKQGGRFLGAGAPYIFLTTWSTMYQRLSAASSVNALKSSLASPSRLSESARRPRKGTL